MISTVIEDTEGGQKFGFDVVLKRKVQTYIEVESFKSCKILNKTEYEIAWIEVCIVVALTHDVSPTSSHIFVLPDEK